LEATNSGATPPYSNTVACRFPLYANDLSVVYEADAAAVGLT
jgi:hypothetical protein